MSKPDQEPPLSPDLIRALNEFAEEAAAFCTAWEKFARPVGRL